MVEIKAASIGQNEFVWSEDMDNWMRAGEVEELKQLFAAVPPPLKDIAAKATPHQFESETVYDASNQDLS